MLNKKAVFAFLVVLVQFYSGIPAARADSLDDFWKTIDNNSNNANHAGQQPGNSFPDVFGGLGGLSQTTNDSSVAISAQIPDGARWIEVVIQKAGLPKIWLTSRHRAAASTRSSISLTGLDPTQ